MPPENAPGLELSIVIPALNEVDNLKRMLPQLQELLRVRSIACEILVVEGGSRDGTEDLCRRLGVTFCLQKEPGYGGALREGFHRAQGNYVLTMDADLSHPPHAIVELYRRRREADILIASRYVWGGWGEMPLTRWILSRSLSLFCSFVFLIPIKDFSSGFRLYRRSVLEKISWRNSDFSSLIEIVVDAYAQGHSVREIPFHYRPRGSGRSHASALRLLPSYLKMSFRLWRLRNSLHSADYDEHAFYSHIPLQKYWQRKRYRTIVALAGECQKILDIGCGSSLILLGLPQSVGMDLNLAPLRSQKRHGKAVVCGSLFEVPFRSESFDGLICSEVIEHVRRDDRILEEFRRLLKPSGVLIVGTPDHANLLWLLLERIYLWIIPKGHLSDHITRYTRAEVLQVLERFQFKLVETRSILGCELIFKAVKQ